MFNRYLNLNDYDSNIRKLEIEKIRQNLIEQGFKPTSKNVSRTGLDITTIFESEDNGVVLVNIANAGYPYRTKEIGETPSPYISGKDEFSSEIKQEDYDPSKLGYNCKLEFLALTETQMDNIDKFMLKQLSHWHFQE